MAQQFWTASDYSVGANTADAFEERYGIDSQLVQSDTDGNFMEVVHPGNSTGGMTFIPQTAFTDGQVLSLLKSQGSDFDNGLIIRANEFSASGGRNYYSFDILPTVVRITKYVSGSRNVVREVSHSISMTSQFWARLEADGSNIRGKIWAEGASEPSLWTVDVTDSSISSAGLAGIGVYDRTINVYQYSTGTGGDSAPTGPVTSTPTITNIDTDNAVNQYQQSATIALSDFTESITSVTLNGVTPPSPSQAARTSATVDLPGTLTTGTYDLVVSGATETATLTGVSYTQTHARPQFYGLVDSNSIAKDPNRFTPGTFFRFVTTFSNGTLDIAAGDARGWQDDIADYYTPNAGFSGEDTASIERLYNDGTTSATVGVTVTVSGGGTPSIPATVRSLRRVLRVQSMKGSLRAKL